MSLDYKKKTQKNSVLNMEYVGKPKMCFNKRKIKDLFMNEV